MDTRAADLEDKISTLQWLLAARADAEEIRAAGEALALSLEFRATDEMIGLDTVDAETLEKARAMVIEARTIAAEMGDLEACVALASDIWESMDRGRAKLAFDAAKRAEHDPRAAYLLGVFAFQGFGRDEDLTASLEHHRSAAEGGHPAAMFELYAMISQGLGCESDPDEALRWCDRAARAGNPRAMANMGGFYATGRGVQRDDTLARDWYDRAARAGHGRAAATLGIMYAAGSGAPLLLEKARAYFDMAESLGFDWRALASSAGVDPELPQLQMEAMTLMPPPAQPPPGPSTEAL
ncbi:MAG TPA: tetratricopeptide repeat protein, partial [Polyangiaceae bacterium]|nr:tetratricopeptide repeat protein [Polyangiaceae bacterium]